MSDSSSSAAASASASGDVESLVAVYRHDVHKLRSRGHEAAADVFHGVRVNEEVPLGADADAALLSRPRGDPEQTVAAHASWSRLSLLTGAVVRRGWSAGEIDDGVRALLDVEGAAALHAAWLDAEVPALVTESPYYPYTSVKYHTLLAATLLDNYRAGFAFDELYVAVTARDGAGEVPVVPHRTVLVTPAFSLHVTGDPGGWPAARLGSVPTRSFADVWSRLPAVPFDVDGSRRWRVLDAQLRRIRSWSAALQFIEEYCAALAPDSRAGNDGSGGDGCAE